MSLFYTLVKPPVQLALRVFFRQLQVRHPGRLNAEGPLLIAANHPNTLMDPLLVAAHRRQQIASLAKSTFFQNPVSRWFMEVSKCIPVYRRQDAETGDAAETPEEMARRNEQMFARCYDHLDQGGSLMIFPEGTSVQERRLRPLKTGAARIALGAEARRNFQLGVRVLPVGLNYSDPRRFRSDALVNVAEPIRVADYADLYRHNPEEAADALTEELRRRLESRLVITRDDAEDDLVRQVEDTFGQYLVPAHDESATPYDNFRLTRLLLRGLAWLEHHAPNHLTALRQHLHAYETTLRQHRLSDEALRRGTPQQRAWRGVTTALKLVVGFPVHVYGVVNNYLPYIIPSMVARRLTKDVEFIAPIMLVTGMLTFGILYPLQTWLAYRLTHSGWLAGLYLLSLPLTGFFALNYWNRLADRQERLRLYRLFRRQPDTVETLFRQRATVLRLLDEARQEYLTATAE
ncbi:lysophospholipid acyltransferase family protein [Hymenobacter busanensis]|nr:lysophospholipid acyltransferase family protein [Hymenobacter busanensis]QHJ07994.1 glycerol acyltransferase [Hymenobacter busanensis]